MTFFNDDINVIVEGARKANMCNTLKQRELLFTLKKSYALRETLSYKKMWLLM